MTFIVIKKTVPKKKKKKKKKTYRIRSRSKSIIKMKGNDMRMGLDINSNQITVRILNIKKQTH